jgi:hypothetical protein
MEHNFLEALLTLYVDPSDVFEIFDFNVASKTSISREGNQPDYAGRIPGRRIPV